MNQIFGWLREQIDKYSYDTETCSGRYIDIIEEKKSIDIINEAEAKWESEVCWWEHRNHYVNCLCKCNGIMIEHDLAIGFTHCPYCGKPIKISEVE